MKCYHKQYKIIYYFSYSNHIIMIIMAATYLCTHFTEDVIFLNFLLYLYTLTRGYNISAGVATYINCCWVNHNARKNKHFTKMHCTSYTDMHN